MLNKNNNNNTTTSKRNVVIVAVLALLLLCGIGRAAYLSINPDYQMVLNGEDEVEVLQNTEYTDDGVTFYQATFFGGKKPVSEETQTKLEAELEITGLDTLDTSVCGDNTIEYRYSDQLLERLIHVIGDGQQPGDNPGQNTTPGGEDEPGGETQTPPPGEEDPNSGTTTNPGELEVYHLPEDVVFNNATFVYDGNYHIMTARNLPEGIIPVYSGNTNLWAGTYDAKVEFVLSQSMQSKYSAVEPAFLTATMTIRKATPTYVVPTGLTATVGQTLRSVKSQLPKGFSFQDPLTTSVGTVGTHVFKVTFTPEDTENYETVTGIRVQITVNKRDEEIPEKVAFHLPSDVVFEDATRTYNGIPQSIYVKNLPAGIIPVYTGNAQTNAGEYEVTVTFTLSDELKATCSGVEPASMTATLTINKAMPQYTVPENLTATVGDTLRNVQLPKGFSFQDPLTTSVGTVGTHVFKVTFTPEDTANYQTVTDIEVLIRVKSGGNIDPNPKTPYYLDNVKFEDLTVTYDTNQHTLVVSNVPAGIIVTYLNNTGIDAGVYHATAVFELSASMQQQYSYVYPSKMTATLTINQATPTGYKVPTGLTATENTTLANVSLKDFPGFTWKDPKQNVGAASSTPKEFTAVYTPTDKNYASVEVTVKVTVVKANPVDPVDPTDPLDMRGVSLVFVEDGDTTNIPVTSANYDPSKSYTAKVLGANFTYVEIDGSIINGTAQNAGTYNASVTLKLTPAGATKYTGLTQTTFTATLVINKVDPTYTVPTNLTAKVGQKLADVTPALPKGFAYEEDINTTVFNTEGKHTVHVTYTPDDTTNYNVVRNIPVTIEVTSNVTPPVKEPLKLSGLSFSYLPVNNGEVEYDGETYTATLSGLGDYAKYVTVSITGDKTATNASTTQYSATLASITLNSLGTQEFSGLEIENSPVGSTVTLTINKVDPTYTVPTNLTAKVGQKLADVTPALPKGFAYEEDINTTVFNTEGTHTVHVTYTPDDTTNYNVVRNIPVTIEVTSNVTPPVKEALKLSGLSFSYLPVNNGEVDYDGTTYTATVSGLGDYEKYVTVSITGNENATNASATQYSATLASITLNSLGTQEFSGLEISGNNPVGSTITLTINKGTLSEADVPWPDNLSGSYGDPVSSITLDSGFSWVNPDQELDTDPTWATVKYEITNYEPITKLIRITVIGAPGGSDLPGPESGVSWPTVITNVEYGATLPEISDTRFKWSNPDTPLEASTVTVTMVYTKADGTEVTKDYTFTVSGVPGGSEVTGPEDGVSWPEVTTSVQFGDPLPAINEDGFRWSNPNMSLDASTVTVTMVYTKADGTEVTKDYIFTVSGIPGASNVQEPEARVSWPVVSTSVEFGDPLPAINEDGFRWSDPDMSLDASTVTVTMVYTKADGTEETKDYTFTVSGIPGASNVIEPESVLEQTVDSTTPVTPVTSSNEDTVEQNFITETPVIVNEDDEEEEEQSEDNEDDVPDTQDDEQDEGIQEGAETGTPEDSGEGEEADAD